MVARFGFARRFGSGPISKTSRGLFSQQTAFNIGDFFAQPLRPRELFRSRLCIVFFAHESKLAFRAFRTSDCIWLVSDFARAVEDSAPSELRLAASISAVF